MPTTDTTIVEGASGVGTARPPSPAFACEAHDLKRILTHIADQIANADKRHSDVLADMQHRLGILAEAAVSMRDQAAAEGSPALEQIEGEMALLADRIVEADGQRRAAGTHKAETQKAGTVMTASHDPEQASPSGPATAPAPLRSAHSGIALGSFTSRDELARAGAGSKVDRFDVVDFDGAGKPDNPWDETSAEALTRLYEAGEARLSAEGEASPSTASKPSIAAAAAPEPHSVAAVTVAAPVASVESAALPHAQDWLEERFTTIASKLEQSVAAMRSGASDEALGERFANLEHSLTQALSTSVTRADVAGLKVIEEQVEDIAAQLDAVQTHFSRLDTIELELRALAERISDEKLAGLFERAGQPSAQNDARVDAVTSRLDAQMPRIEEALKIIAERVSSERIAAALEVGRPKPLDGGAIAKLVAEQVARQLPVVGTEAGATQERVEELRSMIELFVNEHRHGDEQTTTMLDTMQQAMIRLLDRMDAIEMARVTTSEIGVADSFDAGHDYPPRIRAGAAPDAHAPHDEPAPQAAPHSEIERRRSDAPVARFEPRDEPYPQPKLADIQGPAAAVEDKTGPSVAPVVPADTALDNAGATPTPGARQQSREDFVAAARRAARLASEAPNEEARPVDGVTSARKPMPKRANGSVQSLSRVSLALICLIAAGGGFMIVKSTIFPAAPAKVDSKKPTGGAGGATSDKRQQGLDDADGESPGAPAPKAAPNKSSRDGSALGGDTVELTDSLEGDNSDAIPASKAIAQGPLPFGTSEFLRQHASSGQPTSPATSIALSREGSTPPGIALPANEMPPLTIGPNSLRTAAAKGDPSAEFEIGARFAEGRGVPQDLRLAVVWYQRSAAQGFGPAQYRLGSMYERGFGVKADPARARVWYERAAEQGIVKAMHNLAVLSASRDNGTPDYETAVKWFTAAAEHGLADSQFNLAIMRDSGLGMERDAKDAYKWFGLAARAGDDEAARRREQLKPKLSPQELRDIETVINAWQARTADVAVNDPRVAGEGWKQRAR